MPEQNQDELGVLWEKDSPRGLYMTGIINGQKVVVFKNTRKTAEKHPDWRVLKAKPRDQAAEPF
jgi:uncharacterized protein (DUF736 family)